MYLKVIKRVQNINLKIVQLMVANLVILGRIQKSTYLYIMEEQLFVTNSWTNIKFLR